jgi:hypothetical protein
MMAMGNVISDYLDSPAPALPPTHERGRLLDNVPAPHLKNIRADSFPGVSLELANAKLGFMMPAPAAMRCMGFKGPQNFFCRIGSMAKARKKPRVSTGRVPTPSLCVCDFKGLFVPAKHGGKTSVIAFKLLNSGFVHEVYLQRQTVLAAVDAFDEFRDLVRVRFGIVVDTLLFDRDIAFNKAFRVSAARQER